jgi:hypothetical protein
MKSIFAKILLWSFGTLVVSLLAFVGISQYLSDRAVREGRPLPNPLAIQAEDAREAFETGGPEALARYLQRLHKFFPDEHHLTDATGRDLITGQDHSNLLGRSRPRPGLSRFTGGRVVMATATSDGRYRFIAVVDRPRVDPWSFLPYYILVFLAVVLLCYMLAVNLGTPLRVLGKAVEGAWQRESVHSRQLDAARRNRRSLASF